MQTTKIENGFTKNGNARQVVVSTDGKVRTVVKVIRSGKPVERMTIQEAYPGDFVFQEGWAFEQVSVVQENGDLVRIPNIVAEAEKWAICPDELKIWLSQTISEKTAFLPAGFGWDGTYTEQELKKLALIRIFFKGLPEEHLVKILDVVQFSKKSGMPTDWANVERHSMPDTIQPEPGQVFWVVWTYDNKVKMVQTMKSTKNVRGAAKVTLGAYTNAKGPYGIAWQLFRR